MAHCKRNCLRDTATKGLENPQFRRHIIIEHPGMANAPGSSPGRVVRERSGFLSPLGHRTVALVWSADDMFGFPKWRGLIGQAHYIEKGLASHFHSDGWVRHKCVNRLENIFFQIVACRLFAAKPLFELNVGILFTPRLKCIYTSVGVTESSVMPLYDRTTTETEMSPGWLTWLSMGAPRLAFSVGFSASGDGWGDHPGDTSVSLIKPLCVHIYLYTMS